MSFQNQGAWFSLGMLGDTAIAVYSQDERYKHLHGKYAIHP
jgi:valyl-tRNA synthetase